MTDQESIQLLYDLYSGKITPRYFAMMTKPAKVFISDSNRPGKWKCDTDGITYSEAEVDAFNKTHFIIKIGILKRKEEYKTVYRYEE